MALSAQQKAFVRHKVAQEVAKFEGRETMSDAAWARMMNLHENTAKNYRNHPEVQKAVTAEVDQAKNSKDYFKSVIRRVALEELWTRYDRAKEGSPEKRHYLSMILDNTKDIEEAVECVDYSDMTDEDLVAHALQREPSALGLTAYQLLQRYKGDSCSSKSPSSSPAPSSPSDAASSPPSSSKTEPTTEDGTPETPSEKPVASTTSTPTSPKSPIPSSPKATSATRRRPKTTK